MPHSFRYLLYGRTYKKYMILGKYTTSFGELVLSHGYKVGLAQMTKILLPEAVRIFATETIIT
jgi:hypothetical protein